MHQVSKHVVLQRFSSETRYQKLLPPMTTQCLRARPLHLKLYQLLALCQIIQRVAGVLRGCLNIPPFQLGPLLAVPPVGSHHRQQLLRHLLGLLLQQLLKLLWLVLSLLLGQQRPNITLQEPYHTSHPQSKLRQGMVGHSTSSSSSRVYLVLMHLHQLGFTMALSPPHLSKV